MRLASSTITSGEAAAPTKKQYGSLSLARREMPMDVFDVLKAIGMFTGQ